MEKRSLPDIASELLVAKVKELDGVDLWDTESLVSWVHKEMTMTVVMNPKRWPAGTGEKLGPIIVDELNRLLRRSQLVIGGDRTFLYLKVQDPVARLVSSRP